MANLQQERHSEYVDGTAELFVITSTMTTATIPAQLPHLFVFVKTIITRDDPKDDVLARVAQISDLTTLPQGRAAGLASASGTRIPYLDVTCRVSYGTLPEALDAMQAIQDRVNQLINDWITFQATFSAPSPTPANITLPTTNPSQRAALIAAYKAAKEARYTAQQATVAADAALVLANSSYTSANAAVAAMQGFVTTAGTINTEMNTVAAAFSVFKTAGATFLGLASCAAPLDQATFQAALNVAAAQIISNTAYQSDTAANYGALTTYLNSTLIAAQTAAQAALTTAQAGDLTAQQTLTTALALETAALNAVLAVCPDFVSTSVCQVPG